MHTVLLFYKYVTISNPQLVANKMRGLATKFNLKGRGIVAEEGVNATFEGLTEDTTAFLTEFLKDPRFADMNVKTSAGNGKAFPKLSVKVRNEIVGTRFSQEEADPRVKTAQHLPPEELRRWYEENKDFVVVDMRNDYEYASGHFKGSVHPEIEASRDLPQAMNRLEPLKKKTVVTVCTGGVRCEKMSAYLLSKGFEDVYQLENGIHAYMEKYPGEDFLGTLYTFDKRTTMHFGGEREVVGTCYLCGAKTEEYSDCGNLSCHRHFLQCADCRTKDGAFCSNACSALVFSVPASS